MRLLTLLAVVAALTVAGVATAHDNADPGRNLRAKLAPPADGPAEAAGKVDFRQPEDEVKIVFLDVWVRHLLPNRSYYVERATDTPVDGVCTGTNWLRLGDALEPTKPIVTNDDGAGRVALSRDLSAAPTGMEFDIRFRVVDGATGGVVLQSLCYEFTVSQ